MAKATKGGLGRGLNSLISGSMEEAIPPAAATEKPQEKQRETITLDEDLAQEVKASQESSAAQPAPKTAKPTPAKKPLEQAQKPSKAASSASTADSPASASAPAASSATASVAASTKSSASETTKDSAVALPEDDHVVIKGVVERRPEEVPLESIKPNPDQPRTSFKKEDLEELAASIEKDGLLQPIVVRPVGKSYQIIAGERRWRACSSLGMKTVPVRVYEADDDKALELALIENIQRSDLNPIEEAYGYRRLMEHKGMTQSEVAQVVSKGRSTVANSMRLLDLPEEAQQMLFEEKISAGHARAILAIPSKEGRQKLTDRLLKEKLSVREAEAIARLLCGRTNKDDASVRQPTPKSFKTVARSLRESLKTNVRVKTVQGKNKIEIEFKDEEELERLFDLISAKEV